MYMYTYVCIYVCIDIHLHRPKRYTSASESERIQQRDLRPTARDCSSTLCGRRAWEATLTNKNKNKYH